METIFAFGALLMLVVFLWYLVRMTFTKGDRRRAFRNRTFASFGLLVILIVVFGRINDAKDARLAQEHGFENVAEYREAKKSNITSAEIWQNQKAEIRAAEAAEQAKMAEEEAARARDVAAKQAAEEERQKAEAVAAAEAEAKKAREAELAKSKKEEECRADLGCWAEKGTLSAGVYCDDEIDRLASYSSKWTDGILEPKMSRYRWKDKEAGLVTYIGDKVQFQNGFGAWQNMIYECDMFPGSDLVLEVRVRAGRL